MRHGGSQQQPVALSGRQTVQEGHLGVRGVQRNFVEIAVVAHHALEVGQVVPGNQLREPGAEPRVGLLRV
jgi:hypothetical protein